MIIDIVYHGKNRIILVLSEFFIESKIYMYIYTHMDETDIIEDGIIDIVYHGKK